MYELKKKKSSWLISIIVVILLANTISLITVADEIPGAPERFYGNVYINEQPAPNGTIVSAWIGSTQKISQATINGTYGHVPPASEEFNVDGSEGDTIVFKIYSIEVGNDTLNSGSLTQKNLHLNDTESPSNVTGLSVTDAKDGKLDLAWSAATDNLEVSHYRIYRDGNFLINRTVTSYQNTDLTNGQSYSYQVSAVDIAGNEGNKSDSASGTPTATSEEPTPPGPGPDPPPTTDDPPTISDVSHQPATITSIDNVTITAVVTDDNSIDSVTLYWNDSTLHSKAMTLQTGNIYTATIGPFAAETTVTYYIKAVDNAAQETTSDTYNFTTIIVDTTGPTISIIFPLSDSVINNTTPAIQAVYYDPAGINTSSIKILVNNEDVTLNAIVSSTAVAYTPTVSLFSGAHTIYVEAMDNVSNKATKTWSFTIENPTTLNITAAENISAGETKNISLKEYGTILEEMEFTAANNLTDVKINIEMLTEKPEGVTVPSGELYIYLNIESNVNESDITNLTIKFKVEKTWITNNNIDKNKVKLMRYHNNTWEELPTQMTGEDGTYVYYEAQTSGLSTFAVTGIETEVLIDPILIAVVALVILIIVIMVIYYIIILPKHNKKK